jgi:hypothetical protein
MLVGNIGYVPFFPTMFFPGEGGSTAIDKMLYSTETFSVSSTTLTFTGTGTAFNNGSNFGYALASNNLVNKFIIATEALSTLSTVTGIVGTYRGGITSTAGYYVTNPGSGISADRKSVV